MSNRQAVTLLREIDVAISRYIVECCRSPFTDATTDDQWRAEMALENILNKYHDFLRIEEPKK